MKTKKIIKKFYQAILSHDKSKERKFYFKLIKKSLKNKNTEVIK